MMKLKKRRVSAAIWIFVNSESYEKIFIPVPNSQAEMDFSAEASSEAVEGAPLAVEILEKLEVKGRAPKTGYSREEFYPGWPTVEGCSLRQRILKRELGDSAVLDGCTVVSGEFDEPYTGVHMIFTEKSQAI